MHTFYFTLLSLLLTLSACDLSELLLSNVAETQKGEQAVISMAVAQAPLNLDPRFASDAASERVNRLIYQPLVDFDDASKPIPKLAKWTFIQSKQVEFTLNKAIPAFHDGIALTAHDVKATYDSLRSLKNSPLAAEFSNISHITVTDDRHVTFMLKQEDAHFVSKMIIGILPKGLIDARHDFSRTPVGNGPLKFSEWQTNLHLIRQTDQQKIRLVTVKDPTVRVLKLLRGEVDVLQGDLPPELVKFLQTQKGVNVKTGQGANFSYLGLNFKDPILKNNKVRLAIAHAIDTQAIINTIMVDRTLQANAILPMEHYAGNRHLKPYPYNPEYAQQLLVEAGVKLPLKLVYKTSTDAQRVRIGTIMQGQMLKAGIQLSINSLDWGTFFEDVKQGHFQLYGLTWVGIKTPEIYQKVFHSQALPPQGLNRGHFSNAELDDLLEQEDWPAATAKVHALLPYIPLWYEGQFIAAQKSLYIQQPPADGNWDSLATMTRLVPQ